MDNSFFRRRTFEHFKEPQSFHLKTKRFKIKLISEIRYFKAIKNDLSNCDQMKQKIFFWVTQNLSFHWIAIKIKLESRKTSPDDQADLALTQTISLFSWYFHRILTTFLCVFQCSSRAFSAASNCTQIFIIWDFLLVRIFDADLLRKKNVFYAFLFIELLRSRQ